MFIYNKPHSNNCFCNVCKNWLFQKSELAVKIVKENHPNATDDEIEEEAVNLLYESCIKHPEY